MVIRHNGKGLSPQVNTTKYKLLHKQIGWVSEIQFSLGSLPWKMGCLGFILYV